MRAAFSFLRLAVLLLAGSLGMGAADAGALALAADLPEKAFLLAAPLADDAPEALPSGSDADDPALATPVRPLVQVRPARRLAQGHPRTLGRARVAGSACPRAPPVLS